MRPASRVGVFISYRRDDSAGYAGRIYDALVARLGMDRVYMDVDALHTPLGSDYREQIWQHMSSSGIVLAVIGRRWLGITDANGQPRLQDPEDLVRREITFALDRRIPVIPVLVDNAILPPRSELPDSLASLPDHHAIQLSHERWHYDIGRLVAEIDTAVGTSRPVDNPYLPPASRWTHTKWTRPMQLATASFYLPYGLGFLSLSLLAPAVASSVANLTGPQLGVAFTSDMVQAMTVLLIIGIGLVAVFFFFLAFACYRGWRLMFWASLVAVGLIGLGSTNGNSSTLPVPIVGQVLAAAAVVIFLWMIIGLIRFGPGPWSKRRTL